MIRPFIIKLDAVAYTYPWVENNIKLYSISFTRGLDVFQKPMISVGNIVLTTKIKKRASKTRKLEITKMRM